MPAVQEVVNAQTDMISRMKESVFILGLNTIGNARNTAPILIILQKPWEEFCRIIQSEDTRYAMEMIGYKWERDPAAHCMKSLVCVDLDFETVEAGTTCGFLINGLSFGLFILCAIFKF